MAPTDPLPISVISLLDRLDLRLDEPCRVPGCVHVVHADVVALRDPASERLAA